MKKLLVILLTIAVWESAKCQDEQISFQSDGLTLNGTLSIPMNGNEPYPLAILVHGSGPADRNQTITLSGGNSLCLYPDLFNQTIRNFKDIADYLSENGIAVLRYDKRTYTHAQTLNGADILVSDFTTDIESAISFSQTRNEVNENEIFLVGHSQGSSLIPIAAKNTGIVKGLISLAGPTTPIDSLLPEQFRNIYIDCASDPTTGENVANQFYSQFEEIRNGTFPLNEQIMITIPGTTTVPYGYGSFWLDWIEISDNVLQNYTDANVKSLIIQGDDDFNVPFTDANEFLTVPNSEINIFAGINHHLTTFNENMVSDEILENIKNWINACITSSTEITKEDPNQFKIYRTGEEVIIQAYQDCYDCRIKVYAMNGKLIKSEVITDKVTTIHLASKNNLKVIMIEGDELKMSKLIR
jgi:alpha-beta hydrolase superfamily lysophospholipase